MAYRSIAAALLTLSVALTMGLGACGNSGSGAKSGASGDTSSDSAGKGSGAHPDGPGGASASHGKGHATSSAGMPGDAGQGGVGATGPQGAGAAGAAGDNSGPGGLVSGKVNVPAGASAVGVVVTACVPNAAGDCDEALSTQVAVTAKSGVFSFPGPTQTFYLFGWKDADQDTTLSSGDLFGGVVDKDNNLVDLNAPISGLSFDVALIPKPTGTLPAELIGSWEGPNSVYSFKADGTYVNAFDQEFSGTCLIYTKVLGSSEGTAVVSGAQLTLTLTSGSTTTYDCWGLPTSKPANSTPEAFTYFIDLNAQNVPQLHLTYKGSENVYTKS